MAQGRSVLGEQAYRRLKDEIVSGRLAPGELLPEVAVSGRLGLSRTPLREAIGRLAEDGLVEVRPNRPARVRPLRKEDSLELIDFMRTLSLRAHDLAASRISDEQLAELRQRTEEMLRDVVETHGKAPFHYPIFPDDVVYRVAANEPLLEAVARIRPRVRRLIRVVLRQHGGIMTPESLLERLAALERRDADGAVAVMRRQYDALEKAIRESEGWESPEDVAATG